MRRFRPRLAPLSATLAVNRRQIQTGTGTPSPCGVTYHCSQETPANAMEATTTLGSKYRESWATTRRSAPPASMTSSLSTEARQSVATARLSHHRFDLEAGHSCVESGI